MATIGACVSAETKDRFEIVAAGRGTTASRLAAGLIGDFLRHEAGEQGQVGGGLSVVADLEACRHGVRSEQVFVRFDPYYFDLLGRLAAERNWYRGTYLANLFHAHADRRPVLCELEINAVRQVCRQLADMGRNINQIAKKLNASSRHTDVALAVDFDVIKMLIDLETMAVKDLIKENMRGWGVSDGEA